MLFFLFFINDPATTEIYTLSLQTLFRSLLKERAQCERMMAEIDSEERFIEMARAHSLDTASAANGGDSGLIMRGEGRLGFQSSYFDMKVGEMRIFDTPEGCRLVRSIFYTNPPLPSYEQVRENLKQFLENRREVMLVDRLMKTAGRNIIVERPYLNTTPPTAKP